MYRSLARRLIAEKDAIPRAVTVILGSRQTGKTTLLQSVFPEACYSNIEVSNATDIFNSRSPERIRDFMRRKAARQTNFWVLDEVQRLDDPGLVAKVLYDTLPEIHLVITGSSSLEIANRASESLAGRKRVFYLYPLTLEEKLVQQGILKAPQTRSASGPFTGDTSTPPVGQDITLAPHILEAMQYGHYPQLLNIPDNQAKELYLLELVESSILKDVYYLDLVKNTRNLLSLLKLLAYQIGGQVNHTELSSRLGIARSTVADYIEILKKTFVIFTLSPYTKKRRDEIGKMEKVYFYDLGVRNALINDFSPVEFRREYGSLFENFVVAEMMKRNAYEQWRYQASYWRTKWGSEVDLVLWKDGYYHAIEIKTRQGAITRAFRETYPETTEHVITMDNAAQYLLG